MTALEHVYLFFIIRILSKLWSELEPPPPRYTPRGAPLEGGNGANSHQIQIRTIGSLNHTQP